jgi:hypothetical protein
VAGPRRFHTGFRASRLACELSCAEEPKGLASGRQARWPAPA